MCRSEWCRRSGCSDTHASSPPMKKPLVARVRRSWVALVLAHVTVTTRPFARLGHIRVRGGYRVSGIRSSTIARADVDRRRASPAGVSGGSRPHGTSRGQDGLVNRPVPRVATRLRFVCPHPPTRQRVSPTPAGGAGAASGSSVVASTEPADRWAEAIARPNCCSASWLTSRARVRRHWLHSRGVPRAMALTARVGVAGRRCRRRVGLAVHADAGHGDLVEQVR
jgi:hypothetical protein